MEEGKRKTYIKQQAAAKKKQEGSLPPKVTGMAHPSMKRKPTERVDRQPKKPKVTGSVVGETLTTSKLPSKPGPGKGKGLMVGEGPITKKPPVLLCEDSQYTLKQISLIIKAEDYEDLGNHAPKAMGEKGLFSLAQVYIYPFSFIRLGVLFLTLTSVFGFL